MTSRLLSLALHVAQNWGLNVSYRYQQSKWAFNRILGKIANQCY